ncbi:MAG: hypothetical protein ACKPKO_05770, partial [Candidatus Fonsibacter sp.]
YDSADQSRWVSVMLAPHVASSVSVPFIDIQSNLQLHCITHRTISPKPHLNRRKDLKGIIIQFNPTMI